MSNVNAQFCDGPPLALEERRSQKFAPSGLKPAAPSLPAQAWTGGRVLASGMDTYREPHAVGNRGGNIQ